LQVDFIALNSSNRNPEAAMRGHADQQLPLFHTFEVEDRIRADHPLRDIKRRTDRILETLHPKFETAYSVTGRPSVPPERLLKALLLMALYTIRSERQLCEQIDLILLFRWFLDMQPSEDAFDATTFTKNRQRLETHGLAKAFFDAVVAEAITKNLCSEHFSVDGTLIESFASAKSFLPKDAANEGNQNPPDGNGFKPSNPDVDFHGQKRTNETHASRTDPEAKLYRKGRGKEAKLSHMGHVLAENRNGLIVTVTATEANGTAERTATLDMLDDLKTTHDRKPKTLGGDKGFDDGDFFETLERRKIELHVPLVKDPVDPKTVKDKKRLPGIRARRRMKRRMLTKAYQLSQRCRKKVEECFGWLKSVAGMGRSRVVGRWKLRQLLEVSAAAFNLVRMRRLAPVAG
jgi:transposase